MKKDPFIENKIDFALNSLEDVQRSEPSPFFYAKVLGRLSSKQKNTWENLSIYISRPVFAFAAICLIFIMNIIAVYSNTSGSTTIVTEQNEIASADEYTQISNTFYDLENMKP